MVLSVRTHMDMLHRQIGTHVPVIDGAQESSPDFLTAKTIGICANGGLPDPSRNQLGHYADKTNFLKDSGLSLLRALSQPLGSILSDIIDRPSLSLIRPWGSTSLCRMGFWNLILFLTWSSNPIIQNLASENHFATRYARVSTVLERNALFDDKNG